LAKSLHIQGLMNLMTSNKNQYRHHHY
jgi:hypothetical protein